MYCILTNTKSNANFIAFGYQFQCIDNFQVIRAPLLDKYCFAFNVASKQTCRYKPLRWRWQKKRLGRHKARDKGCQNQNQKSPLLLEHSIWRRFGQMQVKRSCLLQFHLIFLIQVSCKHCHIILHVNTHSQVFSKYFAQKGFREDCGSGLSAQCKRSRRKICHFKT